MVVKFIVRLVCYALLLGLSAYAFQTLWTNNGLDAVARLNSFHDKMILGLRVAPLVLALFGAGPLRAVAIFAGFFLAAAAITAPFVCMRIVGV
jgi:hypothetical protein